MQRVTIYAMQGNTRVNTAGVLSSNVVEGSFPGCTVSVFATGTSNLATIFGDNLNPPTPKSNPFIADSTGAGFFYAANGTRVDIQLSGTGVTVPFTLAGDVLLDDFSLTTISPPSTVAFSATPQFDLSLADWFQITLTGNVTAPTFPNANSGAILILSVIQDAVGGRTWAWPASFTDPPAIALGINARTECTFKFDGTHWTMLAATGDSLQAPTGFSIASGEIWVPPTGSIQAAINSLTTGVVRLQPGIYALGNTGITLKSGVQLIGANESSSIITYTGTGAAILLDSCTESALRRVQVQIGSSATAIGVDMQNTTADNKFNTIENVQVQTTGGLFTAGQIGFRYMCSTAFALYWNTMIACQTVKLDTGFMLTNLGAFSANGVNDNKFFSISAHFFTTGMLIQKFATENQIYGLTGSASGQISNNTLLIIGDGSVAANGNHIQGLVPDTGAAGQGYVVKANALNNYFVGVYDTAGRASTIAANTNTIVNGFRNASSQANLNPNGSASNPPIAAAAAPTTGIFFSGGGQMEFSALGTAACEVSLSPPGLRIRSDGAYGFASATDPDGTNDTGIGRNAAGVVSADTTAAGNALGKFKAAVFLPQGATPQKAESAADTNVLTFTPPAVAGTYRLRFVLSLSAASAAVLGWTATWKDANGNAKSPTNLSLYQVGTAAPALTFTTSTATDEFYGDATIDTDNSATNIVIKLTLGSGTFTAKVSATIERLV